MQRATTNLFRGFSTDGQHGKHVQARLRELLRHTAQPVAVVTAKNLSKQPAVHPYHGATLSSFTSIAMHPYPLISFALRVPSRMASILRDARSDECSHMVVNLMSAEQETTAVKFSRADLHSEPFSSIPYHLSEDGQPILDGSLGSLSCRLASKPIPLHDLDWLGGKESGGKRVVDSGSTMISELFIAQVVRVEALSSRDADEEGLRTLPLLYHRRGYTSCLSASLKSK